VQERAARVAQVELETKMKEAKIKEEEAHRLQQELQDARVMMEQNQKTLQEVMSAHTRADDDDVNSEQSLSHVNVHESVAVYQYTHESNTFLLKIRHSNHCTLFGLKSVLWQNG